MLSSGISRGLKAILVLVFATLFLVLVLRVAVLVLVSATLFLVLRVVILVLVSATLFLVWSWS